jgi:carbonic anhydrase
MKLKCMIAAMLLPVAFSSYAGGSAPHWEYGGKHGPAAWGEMDTAFADCKLGKVQSPIDIREAKKGDLTPLAFGYNATGAEVINNGHTIQINLADAGAVTLDGVPYKLLQFHFHTPSEERVDGKSYPLVAHMVHKSADGKLAVVGVMLKEGKENAVLKAVFKNLPKTEGGKSALADKFNAADMLPAGQAYYKYMGSLTTPPCSEGVRWQVMKEPIEVSKEQIKAFQALYKMNARPVQPMNGRTLEQS